MNAYTISKLAADAGVEAVEKDPKNKRISYNKERKHGVL